MVDNYEIFRNVKGFECETAQQESYTVNCYLWENEDDIQHNYDVAARVRYINDIKVSMSRSHIQIRKPNLKDARDNMVFTLPRKGMDCIYGGLGRDTVLHCGKRIDRLTRLNWMPPREAPVFRM